MLWGKFPKIRVFLESPTTITSFSKIPSSRIFLQQLSTKQNEIQWAQRFRTQQHLINTFLNTRNNIYLKKAILSICSRQTPQNVGEKKNTRTNNLHHWKAVSLAIFNPTIWGTAYTKISALIFPARWLPNIHCIL